MTTGFEVTGRIDVHSHYLPPGYRETATAALGGVPDGMLRMPAWDPESTIAVMDRQGIASRCSRCHRPEFTSARCGARARPLRQ